jgi:hypothetical protein
MKIIKSAALPSYEAIVGTVTENIEAFKADKLQKITTSGPAHAGQR